MRCRERQLHPADTGADNGDARCGQRFGHKGVPRLKERPERLGRHGMRGKPRQVIQVRRDADVHAGQVIAQGGAAGGEMDFLRRPVDPGHAVQNDPRARAAPQPKKVDHKLVPGIVAGNMTGQHAGIGGHRTGVDQRQAQARQRGHCKAAQHQRMGVAAPDQHEVGDGRIQGCLHGADTSRALLPGKGAAPPPLARRGHSAPI